jgi:hypothetical protein
MYLEVRQKIKLTLATSRGVFNIEIRVSHDVEDLEVYSKMRKWRGNK